jgi:hypothetical protein
MAVLPSPEDDPQQPSRGRPHSFIELFYEVIADRRQTVNFILAITFLAIACGTVVLAVFYGVVIVTTDLHGLEGRIPGTVAGVSSGTFLIYLFKKAGERLFNRLLSRRDDRSADGKQTRQPAIGQNHRQDRQEEIPSRPRWTTRGDEWPRKR